MITGEKAENVPMVLGLPGKRELKKGGKWSNYASRVQRNVVFFGIERVVPHSERSVSKSYKHEFQRAKVKGYEEKVGKLVGRIIGKKYDAFWFREHNRYRLPHVKTKNAVYSGFNMGAGENALFEIFSTIYAAPPGLLIVADEIELGLHDSAQRRLIDELKSVCRERYIQVICTTHSSTILDRLPPEGRFFIERQGEKTTILPGVSPLYAAGRLAERNSNELEIFVEDGIAEQIVQAVLPTVLRRRINIVAIGSASAVVRQLAARFKNRGACDCIAILDGDQEQSWNKHLNNFLRALESDKDRGERTYWFEERVGLLPGNSRPEEWLLIQLMCSDLASLAAHFRLDTSELEAICEAALEAGKHREFNSMAHALCLPTIEVSAAVCTWVADKTPDQFENIRSLIKRYLD